MMDRWVEEKTRWPLSRAAVKRLATRVDRCSESPNCIVEVGWGKHRGRWQNMGVKIGRWGSMAFLYLFYFRPTLAENSRHLKMECFLFSIQTLIPSPQLIVSWYESRQRDQA